ncbi:XRE family transcriptional regulator [Acinetobacter baumannii]|nr:XRE family transcriptional regulator [Acinetobacter baumannii]ELA7031075.1 XRE family transcriptional regulator [Acinetobacter baumannii]ELA7118838.1 XRE family transcriptional regulator [Acinetobacter baumannii]ELB0919788.1 XRE family transcriptional regulator [Acinetobacter baumannii]ELB0965965.1 XRE family transcriptional regulator [Acinetobacter baumannii]
MAKNRNNMTVAEFLTDLIDNSPKSQREIAEEIGFKRPNVLSMIKSGETRLPIDKIKPTALALGENPTRFLVRVLTEYMPDLIDVIESITNQTPLTPNEVNIIKVLRSTTKEDPNLYGDTHDKFVELAKEMEAETIKHRDEMESQKENAYLGKNDL